MSRRFLGVGKVGKIVKRTDTEPEDNEDFPVCATGWKDSRLVDPHSVDLDKLPDQIKSGNPLPGGQGDPNQGDSKGDENEQDL